MSFLLNGVEKRCGRYSITDAGLEHAKGLTGLTWSNLENSRITGDGVNELRKGLPNRAIEH